MVRWYSTVRKNSISVIPPKRRLSWQPTKRIAQDDLRKKYPRLAELPFDSDRKLMSTINLIDGKNIVIVKGAFDMMAQRCIAGDIETAKRMNEKMSKDALRVLAIGYKEIDAIPKRSPRKIWKTV